MWINTMYVVFIRI